MQAREVPILLRHYTYLEIDGIRSESLSSRIDGMTGASKLP